MSHKVKGCWRAQVKHKGIYIADRVFPRGTSKVEADAWEMKVKLGIIDPKKIDESPTLKEFAEHYLKNHAEVHTLPTTVIGKKGILKNHLIPAFGKMKLCNIKPKHIIEFQAKLWNKGQGKSCQTIGNILSVASQMFMFAVRMELMEYNPCASVSRTKDLTKKKKTPAFWSFAERNGFLGFCKDEDWYLYQLVAFSVTTGLRPGELQGLQRKQLDFDNCFVMVNQNWCTKTQKINPWTKGKIDRKVTVPPAIMGILGDKRYLPDEGFIFSSNIRFNTLGHNILKPMARRAGVSPIRFHDLRHTFASHCVLKGKHQVEIRDLLGHAKLSSTDIYMHLSEDDLKGATDCLVEGMPWLLENNPKVIELHRRF